MGNSKLKVWNAIDQKERKENLKKKTLIFSVEELDLISLKVLSFK